MGNKLCLWNGRIIIAKMTLGKTWPVLTSNLTLPPSNQTHTDCTGKFPHKDNPSRPRQATVSPSFMGTEEIKQNEKTDGFALIERTRENP